MADPYPEIAPYERGMLDVDDGQRVYWEIRGNPDGKPAVMPHGGPGFGCTPGYRRSLDPDAYRIVLFDQRGAGRSTPHAGDPGLAIGSAYAIGELALGGALVIGFAIHNTTEGLAVVVPGASVSPSHMTGEGRTRVFPRVGKLACYATGTDVMGGNRALSVGRRLLRGVIKNLYENPLRAVDC